MHGIGVRGIGMTPVAQNAREAPFGWLLRDEFTDTRAAGAVNGTPATPGPGGTPPARVVTDTGVALSIAGGVATCAAPAGIADPTLAQGGYVRAAGLVLFGQINSALNDYFGFGNNQIGPPVVASYQKFGTTLFAFDQTPIRPPVATVANSTDYYLCVILRTAGSYSFIKGGTFADWTLLWIGSVNNVAILYPQLSWRTGLMTSSFMRIPNALYLPTPLAYDTFTRGNGALGSSEVIGQDGQEVSARAWNNRVGTTLVAGNTASASALVGGIAIATVTTSTPDVLQGAELTRAGGNVGVVVRYADATNYVIGYHDGINAKLDKVVAGVTTPVITAAAAYGAGRVLWIICEGTQFSLYYNNAQIGVTSAINDAALQNGTEQGLYSTNVGNSQDDMLTMARGTNGEYDGLNRYGG